MLIVGGGAALTAIATYLAWLGLRSLRASWRVREAERHRREQREFHLAPGE
jgi:threonine/homoserine/homoserine lactone efflux protein